MTSEGERVDLRSLEKAATAGPWYVVRNYVKGGHFGIEQTVTDCRYSNGKSDAALIAALRNAAPFLLDVVEAGRFRYGASGSERLQAIDAAIDRLDSHLSAAREERTTP